MYEVLEYHTFVDLFFYSRQGLGGKRRIAYALHSLELRTLASPQDELIFSHVLCLRCPINAKKTCKSRYISKLFSGDISLDGHSKWDVFKGISVI
jgi:hypothetical protein